MKRHLKTIAITAACLIAPMSFTSCGGDENEAKQQAASKVNPKKMKEAQAKLKEMGIEFSEASFFKHLQGNCKAEVLQLFIDGGIRPNKQPIILLDLILRGTEDEEVTKCAKVLIQNGINVNVADKNKHSALHYAVERGNIELVKLLIDAKADVNAKNKHNRTVLDCTFSAELRDILIAAGAKETQTKHNLNIDF